MTATTVVLVAGAAALTGVMLGWGGRQLARPRFARRAATRRFAREFAALVDGTELDWATLRGPGHGDSGGDSQVASLAASAAAFVEPTDDVSMLAPKPLSLQDQEYYATSWRNVRGEFIQSPPSALLLAAHLTANLLLNRGLVPVDTARPRVLPESWTFPTARGYRDAMRISAKGNDVGAEDLQRALGLFEDFYWEMLTLSAAVE